MVNLPPCHLHLRRISNLPISQPESGDIQASSVPSNDGFQAPPLGITFDRFVRACVVIKTLSEAFQKLDTDRDGWVQM